MASDGLRSRRVMAVASIRTTLKRETMARSSSRCTAAAPGLRASQAWASLCRCSLPIFASSRPTSIGGFGDTDPYAPAPYGLINRATQLEAFADTMCLDKFTLTGNSQGAWAAVRYACLHPDRVEKLILISSLTIAQGLGIDQPKTPALAALEGYDGTRRGHEQAS